MNIVHSLPLNFLGKGFGRVKVQEKCTTGCKRIPKLRNKQDTGK